MTDKLTAEDLDCLHFWCAKSGGASNADLASLLRHIDALKERVFDLECQLEEFTDATIERQAELAALRAGAPEGWRMVPMQPTDNQIWQVVGVLGWCDEDIEHAKAHPEELGDLYTAYVEAVAAAPQPPAQAVAVRVKPSPEQIDAQPESTVKAEGMRVGRLHAAPHRHPRGQWHDPRGI